MPDALLKAQAHLTERDHTLMSWLYDHGVLTSVQIAHALYSSTDFAQKRLTKLVQLGVIDRFRPQRPLGGSYPYHYLLDQLGYDIVAAQRGQDEPLRRTQARQRRWRFTHRGNLPHLLGVNGFFIDLAAYARTHPDASLDRWWSTSQCAVPGAFSAGTRFVGTNGYLTPYLPVRPDGHGVWTHDSVQVPFWLEYDTGTESMTTLVAKASHYGKALGQQAPQLRNWPLLFSLHSARRELTLHQRLAAVRVDVPVATTSRDRTTDQPEQADLSPADRVWWLHQKTEHRHHRLHLADLPDTIAGLHRSRPEPRAD